LADARTGGRADNHEELLLLDLELRVGEDQGRSAEVSEGDTSATRASRAQTHLFELVEGRHLRVEAALDEHLAQLRRDAARVARLRPVHDAHAHASVSHAVESLPVGEVPE
jgi:hypothetical protein